jgi:hypothetical protein
MQDNPKDLSILKHERPLAPTRVAPHLRDVPEVRFYHYLTQLSLFYHFLLSLQYLLPPALKAAVEAAGGGIADLSKRKKKSTATVACINVNNVSNGRFADKGVDSKFWHKGRGAAAAAAADGAAASAGTVAEAAAAAAKQGGQLSAVQLVAAAEREVYSARRNNVDPLKALAASRGGTRR